MKRILLVEDDLEISELLGALLSKEGFAVDSEYDGMSGEQSALNSEYDVIVLDIMLPCKSGLDVLRTIRPHVTTPVIMLTAKGEDIDRIIGLELGADDYLPKPFNPRELIARINAQLRRQMINSNALSATNTLEHGDLCVNPKTREVLFKDKPVSLTGTEFTLLLKLLQHRDEIVSKEQLSEIALGRKLMQYDRSIDMHMSNLRKKIPELAIKTVRGAGYLLNERHV